MAGLPKDPNMLLSILNMKLRDYYRNLDALCDDMDEDNQKLIDVMAKAGYQYDEARNAFVRK